MQDPWGSGMDVIPRAESPLFIYPSSLAQIPGLSPPKSTELLILVPLIMVVFSA